MGTTLIRGTSSKVKKGISDQYDLKWAMKRDGFDEINSGAYGSVHKNPKNPDTVIKLFGRDHGYSSFVNFVKTTKAKSTIFPKFGSAKVYFDQDGDVIAHSIELERLEAVSWHRVGGYSAGEWEDTFKSYIRYGVPDYYGREIEPRLSKKEVASLLDLHMHFHSPAPRLDGGRVRLNLDLHGANFMYRASTDSLVITDPFTGGPG